MNKTCNRCNEEFSINNFYKQSASKDGFDYYCKRCRNLANAKVIDTKDKYCTTDDCGKPLYAKGYCKMHYNRLLTTGRLYRKNGIYDPEKVYVHKNGSLQTSEAIKRSALRATYNITLEQYLEMGKDGCNVCGETPDISLHVDHDHKCCDRSGSCGNCIRGVVCHRCNVAIDKLERGIIRENYPLIPNILQYLYRYDTIIKSQN